MIELVHDGLPIKLKQWHDLSWLSAYGRLFCVFDQLISGNLCFGLEDGRQRVFIKYAGAPTLMHAGQTEAAVMRLRAAAPRYQALSHPCLSPLLGQFETSHGFGLVFPWFLGFALAPLDIHLDSLHALPMISRLKMYDGLMDFIVQTNARDMLPAGLANQHILVDFDNHRAIFSSVDHFLSYPAATPYPKVPGSGWYLPPEAYLPGSPLDERLSVFALGALARTFFSGKTLSWDAGETLHSLAEEALSPKAEYRPVSCAAYQARWRAAVLKLPRI